MLRCSLGRMVLLVVLLLAGTGCWAQGVTLEQRCRAEIDVRPLADVQSYVQLTHAAEYHGRYYCRFVASPRLGEWLGVDSSLFFRLTPTERRWGGGRDDRYVDVERLEWPRELDDDRYCDLFVRHDTLFLQGYYEDSYAYYLDTVASAWRRCAKADHMVYEDAEFRVYLMDHGEWGTYLWFLDRRDGRWRVMKGGGNVRRIGGRFFIGGGARLRGLSVAELRDAPPSPVAMQETERSIEFFYDSTRFHPLEGEVVWKHSRWSPDSWFVEDDPYDTLISGTFVAGGELQMLVALKDETAVMHFEEGRMVRTAGLGEKLRTFSWHGSHRGFVDGERLLLPFEKDLNHWGLVDVRDGRLRVVDIEHNMDSLPRLNYDGVIDELAFAGTGWGLQTDSAAAELEARLGAVAARAERQRSNSVFASMGYDQGYRIDRYYKNINNRYCVWTDYCIDERTHRICAMKILVAELGFYGPSMTTTRRGKIDAFRDELRLAPMSSYLPTGHTEPQEEGEWLVWRNGNMAIKYHKKYKYLLVHEDAVVLDMQSRLGVHAHVKWQKAAEYHGRYYCAFHYSSLKENGTMMAVVDGRNGRYVLAPMPVETGMHWKDDLFVRHDTLFYHHYGSWAKQDHWFDTTAMQWRKCAKTGDLVHEDADYRVYAMDHGEWGQCTWFIHRATGRRLVVAGIGLLRRAGEAYYIVEPALVRRVSLAQLAAAESSPVTMGDADTGYPMAGYMRVIIDGDTVYRAPDYDGFRDGYLQMPRDTMIVAPYVDGDSLRLLVDLPGGTAVMALRDGRLCMVQDLGRRYGLLRPNYDWRGMLQGDGLLLPWREDAFEAGVLRVEKGQVSVLSLRHNIDTLPLLPTDGLDSLLPFLAGEWGSIDGRRLREFLNAQGNYYRGSDSLLRNAYFREDAGIDEEQHHCDLYVRRVDTLYWLGIQVCLQNADSVADALFFDFGLPNTYEPAMPLWDRLGYEERQRFFQRINERVIARLDALCGRHRRVDEQDLIWHLGSLRLRYYPNSQRLLVW